MLEEEVAVEGAGPVFNPPVYLQRYTTVRDILYKIPGIEKVVDFGCANGKFIKYLKKLPFVREIVGVDLNDVCLDEAAYLSKPIPWDFLFKRHQPLSITIYKGNAAEKDWRLQAFDAVTCIELIEHLEPTAVKLLPENVFGYIRPKVAIFTTPNREFNVLFPNLEGFRHWDHKFEWSRDEFRDWCTSITNQYPEYTVNIDGIGDAPEKYSNLGCCTQMAVFRLKKSIKPIIQNLSTSENDQPYILVAKSDYPGREQQCSTLLTCDKENNCTPSLEHL